MGATATLNIRLPEELKERGIQVLTHNHVSISEAVRRLFLELERSQQLPDCLMEKGTTEVVEEKRQLLRAMTGCVRPTPANLEPPIPSKGHDWQEDWHAHVLEKYENGQA